MGKYSEVFVGIDTAKKKHAVAIADAGCNGETRYLGEIDSAPATVERIGRRWHSIARPDLGNQNIDGGNDFPNPDETS